MLQTHTFISHLPTLSGWVLCVSYYQHILILPSWNNNVAGAQTTQHNWACSQMILNTNADVVIGDVWPLSLNITPQRSSSGTHVPCSTPPQQQTCRTNRQTCRTGLVCASTLWDGEGFKCGSGGIRGLFVDRGRVIVPEDVQLSWVSVSQHTGYHHPVQ